MREEFAGVPVCRLGRNPRRPQSGHAYGNIDEITQHVRDAFGDQDLTTSDVLDFFSSVPSRPTKTLAQKEAAQQLHARRPHPPTTTVRVTGRTCYESQVVSPEEPGPFFCPPIASLVTSGARLLLAMIQHGVERTGRDHPGGTIAYMDTDSAFVVSTEHGGLVPCPGGALRMDDGTPAIAALSWEQVEGIRRDLGTLVPYDRAIVGEHVFKLEDENFALDHRDLDENGKLDRSTRKQLWLYALAEKRYAVYNLADGTALLRDWKESGLGLYLDPKGDAEHPRAWMRDVWAWVIAQALGHADDRIADDRNTPQPPGSSRPDFLDRPAVSRLVVSTPTIAKPFDDESLGARIAPFRFMLTTPAHERNDALRNVRTRYVAPFERDPARWSNAAWVNLYSHTPYRNVRPSEDERDAIALASIGDVLTDWQNRACVSKLRAPDGTRSSGTRSSGTRPHCETVGLLVPMHVTASAFVQTGRETVLSDPLDAGEEDWHGVLDDAGMEPVQALRHQVFHAEPSAAFDGLRAAIRETGIKTVARASGVDRRQLQRFLGGATPHPATVQRLHAALQSLAMPR